MSDRDGAAAVSLAEREAEHPEWFDFSDLEAEKPKAITLPAMLGDYRPVEGKPGWYMRRMKLRQELRMAEIWNGIPDNDPSAYGRSCVAIACCLLFRLDLPDDPAEARARVVAAVKSGRTGDIFRPVTEEELLDDARDDAWTTEELTELVLQPMGFGLPAETQDPNAAAPTGANS